MRHRRPPLPARITLAIGMVLIMTVWGVVRFWASLSLWSALERYAPFPGPLYTALSGALWAVLGGMVVYSMWRRLAWGPRALIAFAAAHASWEWADRLLLRSTPDPGWRFALLMTGLSLGLAAVAGLHPNNRYYFGREAHGREEQDRKAA